MSIMSEEWREIPGFPGTYRVSNLGRVWSRASHGRGHKNGRETFKAPWLDKDGYQRVTIYSKERGYNLSLAVHRLVAEAFCAGPRSGNVVRHLNGDRVDNRAANLAWGTTAENNADLVRHGTHRNLVKTHCPHGHEYTPENTRLRGPRKWRICLTCERRRNRRSAS